MVQPCSIKCGVLEPLVKGILEAAVGIGLVWLHTAGGVVEKTNILVASTSPPRKFTLVSGQGTASGPLWGIS